MRGDGSKTILLYDEKNNELYDSDMKRFFETKPQPSGRQFKSETLFRVSFGKRCNFNCKYCIQPKVFSDQRFNPELVEWMLNAAGDRGIGHVTMWGGEPALYMPLIKAFTREIRRQAPSASLSTLSNGTIFTDENTDWFLENNIYLTLSWDGPGQHLRGEDVLKNETIKRNFMRMYEHDSHNISINPVMTRANYNFVAFAEFTRQALGFLPTIGEAGALIVVDDSSRECAVRDEDLPAFSASAYEAFTKYGGIFAGATEQASMFLYRLSSTKFDGITRCCCTSPNSFAIDLEGNIMTCQSFSKSETDEFGMSYRVGHLKEMAWGEGAPYYIPQAFLKYKETNCGDCLVQKACRANCPYTRTEYREVNCKLLKAYYTAIMAYALYMLTGDTLTHTEKLL